MKQVPILFVGDSPAIQSGLARIGRDLAGLVAKMEEFRVGYLGRGGLPSKRYPFMQYNFHEVDQWGEEWLKAVWEDFSDGDTGVVFTIWDPSRLLWFGNPIGMPDESWLRRPPFQKWGYFAIDSDGIGGKLTAASSSAVNGYDRVLAYTVFGSKVLSETVGKDIDYIPHGINMDTFMPRDGRGLKMGMGIPANAPTVGCVMTNQARKDWALAFETIVHLRKRIPNVMAWFKVDVIDRHWDLRALATDFGVGKNVIIDTGDASDVEMSYLYSACDVTFLPSLGEGFGYPIVESLACGVPCVHGSYGGGAELVPVKEWLVDPVARRIETRHDCVRPVYRAKDFAEAIIGAMESSQRGGFCRDSVQHLNWPNLYQIWQRWFREGVIK